MLRLKKIKTNSNFAEADFYPETSDLFGHIKVDVRTEEIVEISKAEGYGDMYVAHAALALVEMAKHNDQRTERLVMWY